MQVPWLLRTNLSSLYSSGAPPSSASTSTRSAVTLITTPARVAMTTWPESRAARASMPVPTIGLSGSRSGTAWRCMFEPIRARFASSCSRNGISAVATETTCLGLTSMYSIWSGRASGNVSRKRLGTRSATKWPCASSGAFAWATTCSSSSSAGQIVDVVGDHRADREGERLLAGELLLGLGGEPLALLEHDLAALGGRRRLRPRTSRRAGSSWAIERLTLRYGVSMKPYALIRPYVASEPIRPMFGPSGVSMGQIRP